jgi:hypothetical protein
VSRLRPWLLFLAVAGGIALVLTISAIESGHLA